MSGPATNAALGRRRFGKTLEIRWHFFRLRFETLFTLLWRVRVASRLAFWSELGAGWHQGRPKYCELAGAPRGLAGRTK